MQQYGNTVLQQYTCTVMRQYGIAVIHSYTNTVLGNTVTYTAIQEYNNKTVIQ